ncbi:lytic transglycosylase domain-containing protein [Azospirillum agricola]|uniref:lytic transglycosylase domain-containing protein n=1 Tax=Azospirillum agricola TaxID=1720247 RepID=UPI000A0F34A4|nr:lytic transglycosylase domain-containing protein [Azospirillum agricola]SMH60003.1 Sel1 repeat-containing protein [Azospirillum lipoferum]
MNGRVVSVVLAGLLALAAPAALAADKPASSVAELAAPARPSSLPKRSTDCEAAEQGNADAAFRLARRYLFGVGVTKNRRLGTAWLRAAASLGHGEARRLANYVPGRMGRIRPWCRPGAGPVREPSAPPAEIVRLVNAIAPRHGVDPALVLAVIQAESAFRTDAVSPKEAAGLMQLIPDTADRFGVDNVFDPAQNITGGVRYLRWLLSYFQGDVTLALAGYNAGERAVDRFKGVPPYEETRNYVRIIRRVYGAERHPFDDRAADPSPLFAAGAAAELPRPAKSPKKG